MKRILLALVLLSVLIPTAAQAGSPCLERSWIPRTGMPTAEKEWRLVRLVDCAVKRWWPGAGHTRTVLGIADRESCLSCTFSVNWGGCNGNNCYGAWQHSGAYIGSRFAFYLRPEWFRHGIPAWTNARGQAIVTVRMFAAQDGACPAWCVS